MNEVIAVIAPGAMGSAIGRRLKQHGATVLTSLQGRSAAARARAESAGMEDADGSRLVGADLILSIVPPASALTLAQGLAPALKQAQRKPVFIDCNAVSAQTAITIGAVVEATGAPFIDAAIIGLPPAPGEAGPALYVSGPHVERASILASLGLDLKILAAPCGAASALKMSYAGITKGLTGLAAAMMLAAQRAGAGQALRDELERSQPALLKRFSSGVPDMFPKAYRWVAEMQEIAQFASPDLATQAIYHGLAAFYQQLADDQAGAQADIRALTSFLKGAQ